MQLAHFCFPPKMITSTSINACRNTEKYNTIILDLSLRVSKLPKVTSHPYLEHSGENGIQECWPLNGARERLIDVQKATEYTLSSYSQADGQINVQQDHLFRRDPLIEDGGCEKNGTPALAKNARGRVFADGTENEKCFQENRQRLRGCGDAPSQSFCEAVQEIQTPGA